MYGQPVRDQKRAQGTTTMDLNVEVRFGPKWSNRDSRLGNAQIQLELLRLGGSGRLTFGSDPTGDARLRSRVQARRLPRRSATRKARLFLSTREPAGSLVLQTFRPVHDHL